MLTDLGLQGEEAKRLIPLLYHVLGLGDPDATLQHVEPEQLRRQILYAVRTIIERRLALSPLLIVVEDLHWADAVSLEALRFVMDRLERTRLMLLVTHRPAPDNDQLDSSRVSHTALRLSPLNSEDGRSLLAALFGESWVNSAGGLLDQILERAGGNPLFVEEIVRGLIDRGVLMREGQRWRTVAGEAATGIPATIQAMLLARVDRLPQEVRRLAQEAAVIGPRFDATLLKAVTADPGRLEAGCELLCDAEIIEEVAGSGSVSSQSYRFTQTLLQDVIYQNLLLQRRTDIHGRIGAAFEQLCGDNPERLEDLTVLGHHFALSAEREKGAHYLQAAGDRARMIYANDDALRFYERALTALGAIGQTPLKLAIARAHCRFVRPGRPPRDRAPTTTRRCCRHTASQPIVSLRREFCVRSVGCSGTSASGTTQNPAMLKRQRSSMERMPRSSRRISGKNVAARRSVAEITLSRQNGQTRRWIAYAL